MAQSRNSLREAVTASGAASSLNTLSLAGGLGGNDSLIIMAQGRNALRIAITANSTGVGGAAIGQAGSRNRRCNRIGMGNLRHGSSLHMGTDGAGEGLHTLFRTGSRLGDLFIILVLNLCDGFGVALIANRTGISQDTGCAAGGSLGNLGGIAVASLCKGLHNFITADRASGDLFALDCTGGCSHHGLTIAVLQNGQHLSGTVTAVFTGNGLLTCRSAGGINNGFLVIVTGFFNGLFLGFLALGAGIGFGSVFRAGCRYGLGQLEIMFASRGFLGGTTGQCKHAQHSQNDSQYGKLFHFDTLLLVSVTFCNILTLFVIFVNTTGIAYMADQMPPTVDFDTFSVYNGKIKVRKKEAP